MSSFSTALIWLKEGKLVRRNVWKEFNGYLRIENKELIYKDDHEEYPYLPDWRTMTHNDWEILNEYDCQLNNLLESLMDEAVNFSKEETGEIIKILDMLKSRLKEKLNG